MRRHPGKAQYIEGKKRQGQPAREKQQPLVHFID